MDVIFCNFSFSLPSARVSRTSEETLEDKMIQLRAELMDECVESIRYFRGTKLRSVRNEYCGCEACCLGGRPFWLEKPAILLYYKIERKVKKRKRKSGA